MSEMRLLAQSSPRQHVRADAVQKLEALKKEIEELKHDVADAEQKAQRDGEQKLVLELDALLHTPNLDESQLDTVEKRLAGLPDELVQQQRQLLAELRKAVAARKLAQIMFDERAKRLADELKQLEKKKPTENKEKIDDLVFSYPELSCWLIGETIPERIEIRFSSETSNESAEILIDCPISELRKPWAAALESALYEEVPA